MAGIERMMLKIIDKPAVFLLVTIGVFLVLVSVAAIIYYIFACAWNKQTDMTGTIEVGVSLNLWYEDSPERGEPVLHYGKFRINMKEPSSTAGTRLNGPRNWKEKMVCRQYDVSLLVDRFLKKYKAAGLSADPSARMLGELLDREEFCRALGSCFRRSASRGLQASGSISQKGSADQVKVYCNLNTSVYGAITSKYTAETGCPVQSVCVMLNYQN